MSLPSGQTTSAENADDMPRSTVFQPDHAWKALSLVNDWVKHAETKSVAILAAAGVAGGVAYNLLKDQTKPGIFLDIFAVAACFAILLAGLFAMASLAPQIGTAKGRSFSTWLRGSRTLRSAIDAAPKAEQAQAEAEQNPTNLLFYGDIKRHFEHDAPTYAQVLATLTSDDREITVHIARQVHANSLVASRKFSWANRAIRMLRVGVVCLVVVALLVAAH